MLNSLASLTLPKSVRHAVPDDVKEMAEIGRKFFDATILPQYADYDCASMEDTLTTFIEDPNGTALCLIDDGNIVGGIGGYVHPLYFNHSQFAAQQVFWFVLPEYRSRKSMRLLDAWESWSRSKGAKVIWSGAKMDDNYQGMEAMMARRKYAALEAVFIKES